MMEQGVSMYRAVIAFLLLGLAAITTVRAENWIEFDDGWSAFDRDGATYDPSDDVVVAKVDDLLDVGWVAVQCSTSTVWYEDFKTNQWGPPLVMENGWEFALRDALCPMRNSLPYRDF
ncbi:MAG: hypothetical protein C4528_06315 [Gammaproteobacteria bacterium]|nr:MAG: hypothetical protein C4528_06315 [Gammaproteobacteria bacterium]